MLDTVATPRLQLVVGDGVSDWAPPRAGGQAPVRATPNIERRLAAVAFADVAGFSKLIAKDEVDTTKRWRALRVNFLEPKIKEFSGRLLRVVGDALFVEFPSAVYAVKWALDVQRASAAGDPAEPPPLKFRIGINVEDVVVDGEDLHGDGVNIAARIQQLAKPGEILVTETVYTYLRNRVEIPVTDLGERELKNISQSVRVYRLGDGDRIYTRAMPSLSWSNRPWIAILPFRNLGGDPEEDYFGEGITEDIITVLSRGRSLSVIAHSSTLRYRDQHLSTQEIAAELGVRYVVEGSVRRQAARLRISCDLIDASRGRTIWAERYDGMNDDIFAFQDRIASEIVAKIEPQVFEAETERARAKPTESLDAYDCILRATPLLHTFDLNCFREAEEFLDRALELDVGYSRAYAYKAWLRVLIIGEARSSDIPTDSALARQLAERAVALDRKDSFVLAVAGHVVAFLHKDLDQAVDFFERALEFNENSAFAWGMSGITYGYLDRSEEALARFQRAWRLSPFDPFNYFFLVGAAMGEFVAGRYNEASVWARKTIRANPRFIPGHRHLVTSLLNAGRLEEARVAAAHLLALVPTFSVSTLASWYPMNCPATMERYIAGLRLAGLPD